MLPVSVVVPVHNRARWLREALESVRLQTKQPQEIVVVDDGSTEPIAAATDDYGVRLISQRHAGPATARNRGLVAARSGWIAFLDSDDLWDPLKLERQADAIEAHGADLCFTDLMMFRDASVVAESTLRAIGPTPNPHVASVRAAYAVARRTAENLGNDVVRLGTPAFRAALARYNFVFPSSLVVRRDLALGVGGFHTKLQVAEDWDFLLRVSRRNVAALAIDAPLVRYRLHGANASGDFAEAASSVIEMVYDAYRNAAEYPDEVRRFWRSYLPAYATSAGLTALGRHRFRTAKRLFSQSLRISPSVPLALGLAVAIALDQPVGGKIYDAARAVKHSAGIMQPWR